MPDRNHPFSSQGAGPLEERSDEHERLGQKIHAFQGRPVLSRAPKSLLVLGVLSALMVPVGIKFVPGMAGTILAVLAGLVTLACYLLSGGRRRAPGIDIEIFEQGIVCCQGTARRELRWNEVVDISARKLTLPAGKCSTAIVLEVVCSEPLLIVVGAPFTDAERTRALVDALSGVWLEVWCRRARAVLQADRSMVVGQARVSPEGAEVGALQLTWDSIVGVESSGDPDRLATAQGAVDVEVLAGNTAFPSAARRLSALAKEPPIALALPLG
jgi:hypothetical protein